MFDFSQFADGQREHVCNQYAGTVSLVILSLQFPGFNPLCTLQKEKKLKLVGWNSPKRAGYIIGFFGYRAFFHFLIYCCIYCFLNVHRVQ